MLAYSCGLCPPPQFFLGKARFAPPPPPFPVPMHCFVNETLTMWYDLLLQWSSMRVHVFYRVHVEACACHWRPLSIYLLERQGNKGSGEQANVHSHLTINLYNSNICKVTCSASPFERMPALYIAADRPLLETTSSSPVMVNAHNLQAT